MQFNIYDIQKKAEGQSFDQTLDLADQLKARNSEILDVAAVRATGTLRFEAGLFLLDYVLSYQLTLASSRSLAPVVRQENYQVNELFVADEAAAKQQDLVDAELLLVVEDETIDLAESVADNILLNIPLKVLTPEEEAADSLPQGKDWQVLTEADYAAQQAAQREATSPFAGLAGLFDED